jgi:acyl-coenzyme A synthetase/AMP-(fatty) acid ligase
MQDIVGTLTVGATLVMLHPKGTMDYEYLTGVLKEKRITYMHSVPTQISYFFHFLKENKRLFAVETLRSLCSIGEPFLIIRQQ